jgi:hypothetical protein
MCFLARINFLLLISFLQRLSNRKKKAIISRKTKKVDEPKGSGPKSSDLRLLTPLARPAILSMHL